MDFTISISEDFPFEFLTLLQLKFFFLMVHFRDEDQLTCCLLFGK